MVSCVAAEVEAYSTSIVDSDTTNYFLLHQEIVSPLSKKVYAEVDLRSSISLALILICIPMEPQIQPAII